MALLFLSPTYLTVRFYYRKKGSTENWILQKKTGDKTWKSVTKSDIFSCWFSKWIVLRFKMARFARQNESFCVAKWPFSTRKMIHFTSPFFVKKIQGASFQRFRKCARFAHTRPSDFYFQTMAFSDGFFRLFVQFFQKQKSPSVVGKGGV